MYSIPKLIDVNAKSRHFSDYSRLLVIGRCVEYEHPSVLKQFRDWVKLSVCLEEEHMNHVGLKLAAILARNSFKEVGTLTTDGSPHCVQLHYMLEEVFKVMGITGVERRHFVISEGSLIEVGKEVVKASRYLAKVQKLMKCNGLLE